MNNVIVPIPSGAVLPTSLAPDLTRAAELAREEKAASTRRAYRSDFRIFHAWCQDRAVSSLPAAPETVAAFLARDVEAGSRPSTLGRRVSAIRYAHKLAGHPAPTDDERVKATMRGIRRSLGTAPRKKVPATAERIVAMALAAGEDIKGLRDRAVLLLGFAGAFRRSELVALNVEDLEESELGFKVIIRHSKTDQEGAGQTIAIIRGRVACPVTALKTWLEAAGITSGPIFHSVKKGGAVAGRLPAQSVADIVKIYAERVGLDPAMFAGHSMRSGFLTSAAKRGASIFKMMDQSRHRSVETLRGYVRDAEIFKEHAGAGLL
jgi:site-specific recombinase XerD